MYNGSFNKRFLEEILHSLKVLLIYNSGNAIRVFWAFSIKFLDRFLQQLDLNDTVRKAIKLSIIKSNIIQDHAYHSGSKLFLNEHIIYSYTCLAAARPPLSTYNSFDCHLQANRRNAKSVTIYVGTSFP